MFSFVPLPPKDYVLKSIPKCQRDSPQFTPEQEPRVTQTTLGVFCSPIEYAEGEMPEKVEIQQVHPKMIEKWAKEARAFWVDKPGKDDFYLHDMYKKYSVEFDSYNPNFRHKEKVFNRSYKYELVCLENTRLQKLREKCEREQSMWDNEFNRVEKKEHEEKHPPMKVLECKAQPPFWWKTTVPGTVDGDERVSLEEMETEEKDLVKNVQVSSVRWTEEPCLTAVVCDDPCRRKYDMQLVGQPFKSEACNFYYTNYPPPAINFRVKRFA